jgi:hypothetical protein
MSSRASWVFWALFAVGPACRDGAARSAHATADTPALLRVMAQSRNEFRATPGDRRRRIESERLAAKYRRPRPPTPAPTATTDSSAGQVTDTLPAPGPMQSIRIVPGVATLRVGETATLALEALDSAGRLTHVAAARWRPDDTEIVTLDRTGAVAGTAPGSTEIEAWVGTARARARIDVLPVVRGRVVTIDGDAAAGAQVRFVAADFADSVILGPDGRFEFRPPSTYADAAELSIRAVGSRSAQYHPMVARLTARETGPQLGAVLVPTSWTITSGTYAGATLAVSAEAALRRWRGTAPFARSAAYRGRRTRRVVGWAPEAFPLPVAFVRERSTLGITTADSIAFWNSVRRLEGQLGMTVFRPADSAAVSDGRPVVEVVIDPRTPPAAMTWASWVSSGDLNDARVAVRSAADFRNSALISHEMLHALGFGHALGWRSVMTGTASPSIASVTAEDVAYVQLVLHVRAAQSAFGAELGFLEAAEGERRARQGTRRW